MVTDPKLPPKNGEVPEEAGSAVKRPTYFDAMRGTLKNDPSLDLTQPPDPEWGKVYEDEK